jgi:aspartokinase
MGEKSPLDGMNVRGGLARISVEDPARSGDLAQDFLRLLAQNRVNMNLFITGEGQGRAHVVCCVAGSDGERMRARFSSGSGWMTLTEYHEPVDLVSIFPHRSSMKMLGLALIALAEADVPLQGFCSSLSSLTFMIHHNRLEEACTALKNCFDLPGERVRSIQS